MKYFITYLWRRGTFPLGAYEIAHDITGIHPFLWQKEMNELNDWAAERNPNLSNPKLNQTTHLLWWKEITDEEAELAGDIFQ